MVPYVTMIHEYIIVRHIPIVTGLNSAFVPEVPFILIERTFRENIFQGNMIEFSPKLNS